MRPIRIWGSKKIRFALIGVVVGVVVAFSILIITLGKGDTVKDRKIAEDLLQYHRRLKTNDNLTALLLSITNLPFSDAANLTNLPFGEGGIIEYPIQNHKRVLCMRLNSTISMNEYYWIDNSTTNLSQWILYHGWYWKNHRLVEHKLLTIVETNAEMTKP